MAIIGQTLTSPEDGWVRYDDHEIISFVGSWKDEVLSGYWGTNQRYSDSPDSYFFFSGTISRFRLIVSVYNNRDNTDHMEVFADDVSIGRINTYNNIDIKQALVFEHIFPDNSFKTIKVINIGPEGRYISIDAVDVNEDAVMEHTIKNVVEDPDPGWKRIDDSDIRIGYLGTGWYVDSNAKTFEGSEKGNTIKGDYLCFKGKFSKLRLLGSFYTRNSSPQGEVFIDGVSVGTIDTDAPILYYRGIMFEKLDLPFDVHEVKIVNIAADGRLIVLDAIDIDEDGYLLNTIGSTLKLPEYGWYRWDDTHPEFKYTGEWTTQTGVDWYNGAAVYASKAGASFSFKFYGDSFRIVGSTYNTRQKESEVYIDGVLHSTYNQYEPGSGSYNIVLHEVLDLDLGEHTVVVSNPSNAIFGFDALDLPAGSYLIREYGSDMSTEDPEWKRYNNLDGSFIYSPNWSPSSGNLYWGGPSLTASSPEEFIKFDFIGTSLRIISAIDPNNTPEAIISIDGEEYEFSLKGEVRLTQRLVFEIKDLENIRHSVVISARVCDSSNLLEWSCVDLPLEGRLLHQDEVLDFKDLEVGKRIKCAYEGYGSFIGSFGGLGQEFYAKGVQTFLQPTPTAIPTGNFYFICVEKSLPNKVVLVADRMIRNTISWDIINTQLYRGNIHRGVPTVPLLTSLSERGVSISVSGTYSSNYGWKAFNKVTTGSNYWYVTSAAPEGGHWYKISYETPRRITSILLQALVVSGSNCSIKDFILYGSNNDIDYEPLFEGLHPNNTDFISYYFDNGEYYKHYRINLLSSYYNVTTNVGIQEMQLYEDTNLDDSYYYDVELISSQDWDNYIVNSDLNNTIEAGDNSIWNWDVHNIYSLTSSTGHTQTSRIFRGNGSSGSFPAGISSLREQASSLSNATTGFRPKMVITSANTFPKVSVDGYKAVTYNRLLNLKVLLEHPKGEQVRWKWHNDTSFSEWAAVPITIEREFSLEFGLNPMRLVVEDTSGRISSWIGKPEYLNFVPEISEIEFSKTYFWHTEEGYCVFKARINDVENKDFYVSVEVNGELKVSGILYTDLDVLELNIPLEVMSPGANLLKISVEDTLGASSSFSYTVYREDSGDFVLYRFFEYDTSAPLEGNLYFSSGEGYSASTYGKGSVQWQFPTEGKGRIKNIKVNCTDDNMRRVIHKKYPSEAVSLDSGKALVFPLKEELSQNPILSLFIASRRH